MGRCRAVQTACFRWLNWLRFAKKDFVIGINSLKFAVTGKLEASARRGRNWARGTNRTEDNRAAGPLCVNTRNLRELRPPALGPHAANNPSSRLEGSIPAAKRKGAYGVAGVHILCQAPFDTGAHALRILLCSVQKSHLPCA